MPEIRHGYTLADIDRLAKTAATAAPTAGLDGYTRYSLAWSAIAEALCAEEEPTRRDLVQAGWQAINREITACLHARGYLAGHAGNGTASSPRYMRYWTPVGGDNAIDRLVDHIAAQQAGDVFTAAQGSAVDALAWLEDHTLAADALGIGYGTFSTRLAEARARFRAVWYAPETPPRTTRHDKRRGNRPPRTHCAAGHPMDGDNLQTRRRKGGKTERICRTCEADRGRARREQAAA